MVLIAHIGFVASNVFYDAFLPELTTEDTIDRVSSKGFAYGYVGGGLYLVLALGLLLVSGEGGFTGLSSSGAARLAIFGSGVWWAGFSLFSLRYLPGNRRGSTLPPRYRRFRPWRAYTAIGFGRTLATVRKLRGYPQLLLFVAAFIFYNDGTQTVIYISGSYAADTLDLDITVITLAFLLVQFVAFGGALFFGVMAERIGPKRAILWSIVVWALVSAGAYFLPAGQALPFLPYGRDHRMGARRYPGSEPQPLCDHDPRGGRGRVLRLLQRVLQILGHLGPLVFGIVSNVYGSGRPAILSIVVFFVIGGLLLARVDVDKARAARSRWEGD